MKRMALCLAGLLVAGAALAEDFWGKKEYMQWTDEEIKKVMTDSPWAKEVTITAPPSALRGQRAAQPTAEGDNVGGGGGGGGRGGRGGGGGGGGGGRTEALLKLTLSWRTALPLRKALVRSRLGAGAVVPPEAQQLIDGKPPEYVLVVSGVPTNMARAIQVEVAKRSTIRFGKKPPLEPKGVDMQAPGNSAEIIFAFPKTQEITADEDKEVEVILKLDMVEVKKKFNLKDMVYNGKLEL